MSQLCSEDALTELMREVETDDTNDVSSIDALLIDYPEDPRLHFLRGSVLVSDQNLVEAHAAMKRAVEIAPDFLIARFQLGFFELSSGEPQAALANWQPLEKLPEQHYLRRFVTGLTYLIQDEFQLAVNNLESGISINNENPPLNNDMQLIIDKCKDILTADDNQPEETVSSTSVLLNQFSKGDNKS